MTNLRAIACQILYQVINKQTHLKQALLAGTPKQLQAADKAWIQSICYQTLRHHQEMTARWQKFTNKTVKDKMIALLLTLSVTQKFHLNTPDHAIVNESVKAAKKLKKNWATGLINKVLKLTLQDKDFSCKDQSVTFNHPQWWINAIKQDWPKHYQNILAANNQKPPLWIRCQNNLDREEIVGTKHSEIPSAILIDAQDITSTEMFQSGKISVQDAAAQFAANILKPAPNDKILDACAAPGGKSCHLLQLQENIKLDVLEKEANRMNRVKQNLERIGQNAHLIIGDATNPESWHDGQKYDKILLDVPCSASGVVRRNPDIKLLRKAEHIDQLAQLQQNILRSIAPLLKVGGDLLYVTCSIFKQENQDQIQSFLNSYPNYEELPLTLKSGTTCQHGTQIITGTENMDGFYYCHLKRMS